MDFALTEEQTMIVDMVRRFVRQEILPLEDDLDPDADEVAPEVLAGLVAKTKEMGLYGLDTPPEYGGPDINMVTRVLIAIECAQHRAGLYAPCYYAFGGARQAQLFEATEAQKEKYLYPMLRGEKRVFFGLSEPSGGSDPARAIQTRAVRDGNDHWVLNGTKLWISGADRADYGLVFARTGGPGRGGVTAFIVE
ncbi:MAG: acyl-CoA dehydrogenase family protein, partial [Proteobacteria bacterium]|nr:acyl-CoA dehydrogenase family protein [Pseudomonadota bacterium]